MKKALLCIAFGFLLFGCSENTQKEGKSNKLAFTNFNGELTGKEYCNCIERKLPNLSLNTAMDSCDKEILSKNKFYKIYLNGLHNPSLNSNVSDQLYDSVVVFVNDVNDFIENKCYPKFQDKVTKQVDCNCKFNDATGYLSKICLFIKENQRIADKEKVDFDPCNYEIRKITTEIRKADSVIAVYLNCCYTGDVAYFDKKTKEIISFSVGPK